jgi:hypothetical protein
MAKARSGTTARRAPPRGPALCGVEMPQEEPGAAN